ncbi:CapA family protein [Kordiimonas sp. SCSIO 12603]|uniref:CapA family protein n=1 Tax=Kordiimonas sp. SCSIO 12603 TaxID=2829596 RepID=UPI002106FEC5|nr:CapA family protein [Kordiimonas sp. SCSIO 12603]UTW58783.1 CapA family protein [Kordiimonas sp. SCSIO 12603]
MKLFASVLAIITISTLVQAETIKGTIVDENGRPLIAQIATGGSTTQTKADGSFSIDTSDSSIQQLEISADGHYSMLQTFSYYELELANFKIPTISMVAKASGRTLMVFAGDTMMGRRFYKPHAGEPQLIHRGREVADMKAILAHMKPYLELADFASTNLETQIFEEEPNEKAPKSVTFFTRPAALEALNWAGIDYVTLGNNHTYDYLDYGLEETFKALEKHKVPHSGAGFNEQEALTSYSTALAGTQYAFEGYVGWAGTGKISQAAGQNKGGPALGTSENILTAVKRDKAKNTIPIVQYHGSLEYGEEPSLDTETRLKQAVDAGAALAIAHHPHVYQGLELYEGSLIAWSLGNFVFDQYFYAAQETALLYVWMDNGKFHRAEVVPIYVKGYKPTPATGAMRHSIMKRISTLSAKRHTYLKQTGGHGYITAENIQPDALSARVIDTDSTVQSLQTLEWSSLPDISGKEGRKLRLGEDILARGDFEAYATFNAPDRSWLDLHPQISISSEESLSGKNALKISQNGSEKITTGMRKFTRVFAPGNPMTLSFAGKATKSVEVRIYMQRRKTRDKLFTALNDNPRILLGKTRMSNHWQQHTINFDSPRVGTRSIRILIEVENLSASAADTFLDDINLIEWKTPFLKHTAQVSASEDISHVGWQ